MTKQVQSQPPDKSHESRQRHRWPPRGIWIIILIVLVAVIAILAITLLLVQKQGISQSSTALSLIFLIVGVVISLLGLMFAFFQWYYPRPSGTHTSSTIPHTPFQPTSQIKQTSEPFSLLGISNDHSHEVFPDINKITSSSDARSITLEHVDEGVPGIEFIGISLHREDLEEAPHIKLFYGRDKELADLTQWILNDHCRLVALLGMGGVGKTALAAKLVEQIKATFEYVIWRSLQNVPPIESFLRQCLRFVSGQQSIDPPDDMDSQISLLIQHLREHHCLLVLDNIESVMQGGDHAGYYREGYEGYGKLIQRIEETRHQSCLLLTSREKPKDVAHLEGKISPVRSLQLQGVSQTEGQEILKDKDLFGTDAAWAALIYLYAGNPLALKLVSESIREVFQGDIAKFLREEEAVFGDIHDLLDQQFHRLSPQEQEIMYWLAIEREPVALDDLREDIVRPVSKGELLAALDSLRRRSMIEVSGSACFSLQPVIMEYITDLLVLQISVEIDTEAIRLFGNCALIKAQGKDYVRDTQVRLILKPVAERLLTTIGKAGIEKKLRNILDTLRKNHPHSAGYAAGNLLNLLIQLGYNLGSSNFSDLTIRQAYLQGVPLTDVNFSGANLAKSVFTETFNSILSVAFSPNGILLASGTGNGEIRVWQVPSGTPFRRYQGHTDCVWSVAFSFDGQVLASGSGDRTIRLWDISTGECLKTLLGHSNRIRSISFSPDGKVLASGSEDQTIRLWKVSTGECLKILQGSRSWIKSIAYSPNGQLIASSSDDHAVRLWEVSSSECLKTLQGHTDRVWSVAFSPDGKLLASGSEDQTMRLWEISTGQCLKTLQGYSSRIRSISFSPDGKLLASGSEDQTIRLWKVSTGECLKTLQGHVNRVRTVAFSPDGKLLGSGSEDQTIRLWEVSTAESLKTLQGHSIPVRSIAFSSDGHSLASGSDDKTVRLWDISTGQSLLILQGHTSPVRSVAFSPDGKMLASGSEDRTVHLWEVSTGECLKILQGHTGQVWSVAFSPDGSLIGSGSNDGTIKLWDLRIDKCIQTLRSERLYERMNITNTKGLTKTQKATLRALGAIENQVLESRRIKE